MATGGALAKAPSAGVLTTWRIGGFSGTARLLVLKAAGGGSFTIESKSAPVTKPCVGSPICGPQFSAPYEFKLSPAMPIKAGEYIGVEATGPPECNKSPDSETCTWVGIVNCTKGGEFLIWTTTPPIGSASTPDTQQKECELAVNADEQTSSTSVGVSLKPATITADGRSTTAATATVTREGKPVTGDTISFTSSDGNEKVGAVHDNGDGTYTATITASEDVGMATVTATDLSDPAQPSGNATLTQGAPTIAVSVSPGSIHADGKSSATAKVTLTGVGGEGVQGQSVSITTSGPALAGLVSESGDGVYTTTITSVHSPGKVTVTGTDLSVAPNVSAKASLETTAPPGKGKHGKKGKGKKCVVPKLVGDTLKAAEGALRRAKCAVGKVTKKKSKKVHKGRVISSSPKAGTRHKEGTRVDLAVSRGPR